jgi:hypothetical protein
MREVDVNDFFLCSWFDLAWLLCVLLLAVLPGVVMDHDAHVIPLPILCQVMGDFRQLDEEPGKDDRGKMSIRYVRT